MRAVAAVLVLLAGCASWPREPYVWPRHRYRVPADVERLLLDPYHFRKLAHLVRLSTEKDLALGDRLAPRLRRDRLFDLALLDALDGKWELAVKHLDDIAREETDPVKNLMTGLTIRVWADAHRAAGGTMAAFGVALEQRVSRMPYALVAEELGTLRQTSALFTRDYCVLLVREYMGEAVERGSISTEQASVLLFQRYVVVHLLPVGPVIVEVLDRVMGAA